MACEWKTQENVDSGGNYQTTYTTIKQRVASSEPAGEGRSHNLNIMTCKASMRDQTCLALFMSQILWSVMVLSKLLVHKYSNSAVEMWNHISWWVHIKLHNASPLQSKVTPHDQMSFLHPVRNWTDMYVSLFVMPLYHWWYCCSHFVSENWNNTDYIYFVIHRCYSFTQKSLLRYHLTNVLCCNHNVSPSSTASGRLKAHEGWRLRKTEITFRCRWRKAPS